MCESIPPAVMMRFSPAMASVPGPMTMSTPGADIWVAGFADTADAAVADADIGFDDTPMIEDHGIGDDSVHGALCARRLPLPHAVADDLATAEFDFLAVNRTVTLDFDDQLRICEAHPVPGRRAKHRGIGSARDRQCHRAYPSLPLILPLKPITRRAPA
jgi:hypothetical protein